MKKVSIIGSGTMGNGIAHCFAQKGFNVSIFDISKENLTKAEANISKNLDRMIKKEKISELEKKNILSRITFLNELEENIEDTYYFWDKWDLGSPTKPFPKLLFPTIKPLSWS